VARIISRAKAQRRKENLRKRGSALRLCAFARENVLGKKHFLCKAVSLRVCDFIALAYQPSMTSVRRSYFWIFSKSSDAFHLTKLSQKGETFRSTRHY